MSDTANALDRLVAATERVADAIQTLAAIEAVKHNRGLSISDERRIDELDIQGFVSRLKR